MGKPPLPELRLYITDTLGTSPRIDQKLPLDASQPLIH